MNIYIPNVSEQSIGGGWTFMRNFRNGLKGKVKFVDRWQDCDIVFIAGPTLADRNEMEEAYAAGKKIVLRVDNIPRKSRNKRSRSYDNLRRYTEMASHVVFQSNWARGYTFPLTGHNEKWSIIYNGVDTSVFYPPRIKIKGLKYLYVQFNRDENKRFTEAAYYFQDIAREYPYATLTLVGQFSPELVDADFDFFNDENVHYLGIIADPDALAQVYRDHDVLLFPAFADAAPNTVLEARACGLEIACVNPVGGTIEMVDAELDISLERMCQEYINVFSTISN